jgi:hypothetical protein
VFPASHSLATQRVPVDRLCQARLACAVLPPSATRVDVLANIYKKATGAASHLMARIIILYLLLYYFIYYYIMLCYVILYYIVSYHIILYILYIIILIVLLLLLNYHKALWYPLKTLQTQLYKGFPEFYNSKTIRL